MPVANPVRNDFDTIARSKSPRRASGRGTGLRTVTPAAVAIAPQHAGSQLYGSVKVDGLDEQLADDAAPDPSTDQVIESTTVYDAESTGPDADAWRRVLKFLADGEVREEAVYERARNRLLQFFAARGKLGDEELADATFDRVVAKLSDEVAAQVRCPVGYMLRFAHFIYLEHIKSDVARQNRLAMLQFEDADSMETAEEQWIRNQRLTLLERCLDELPVEERDLLLSYYTHDGRSRIVARQKMSRELGITPALLRTRVSRLLGTLNQRVRSLAKEAELA